MKSVGPCMWRKCDCSPLYKDKTSVIQFNKLSMLCGILSKFNINEKLKNALKKQKIKTINVHFSMHINGIWSEQSLSANVLTSQHITITQFRSTLNSRSLKTVKFAADPSVHWNVPSFSMSFAPTQPKMKKRIV